MVPNPRRFTYNGPIFWILITFCCAVVFFVFRSHIFPELIHDSKLERSETIQPKGPVLEPPPSSYDVVVTSTPSNVRVTVDGEKVGLTPLTIRGLASGAHFLALRRSCYRTVKHEFVAGVGDGSLDFKMELVCGNLTVSSQPRGADVIINGKKRGVTPYQMIGVRIGELDLLVRLGLAEQRRGVMIRVGRDSVQPFDFTRPNQPAHRTVWQDYRTGMTFVWVKGGCFSMGNPESDTLLKEMEEREKHRLSSFFKSMFDVVVDSGEEEVRDFDIDEAPIHQVCLDGLWVGQKEVTNNQYLLFSKDSGVHPEWSRAGDKYNVETGESEYYKTLGGSSLSLPENPVVGVSWHDVRKFNRWFTQQTSFPARLLTEAEWEYVCRSGGLDEEFSGGNDVDSFGWYQDNSDNQSHKGGLLQANGLGLFDLSGNVWEWTEDYYHAQAYAQHAQMNPVQQAVEGDRRMVVRGGSWRSKASSLRCTARYGLPPDDTNVFLGFRVVMVQEDK